MPQVCGKQVGPIGYGLMSLTWRDPPPSEPQAFAALRAAIRCGATFWNGGEFYGTPTNNSLTLLSRYFEKYPEDASKVVLSIKGCIDPVNLIPQASAADVERSIGNCVSLLSPNQKKIDTFECARVDKSVPLSESLSTLQQHVENGQIGGISLSEVRAATVDAAAKMVKIDTVEVELSIWAPDVLRNGVAESCARNGIVMVAYSPIAAGMLAGVIKSPEDIPKGDFRHRLPRFAPEAMKQNIKLSNAVGDMARRIGCTPAQLAIGWVRCLSKRRPGMPEIIPIPGSSSEARVMENCAAVDLTDAQMDEIDGLIEKYEIVGGRYPEGHPIEG